ncbi:hypothetical protein BDQ17DRAFT_1429529 [Cyathus striatus]|nr:hypothetical protein BDQ17DRAFT_1429529 [Cyathus striatus]
MHYKRTLIPLLSILGLVAAVPVPPSTEIGPRLAATFCTEDSNDQCLTLSIFPEECNNIKQDLTTFDSAANLTTLQVPGGFVCSIFANENCETFTVTDALTVEALETETFNFMNITIQDDQDNSTFTGPVTSFGCFVI